MCGDDHCGDDLVQLLIPSLCFQSHFAGDGSNSVHRQVPSDQKHLESVNNQHNFIRITQMTDSDILMFLVKMDPVSSQIFSAIHESKSSRMLKQESPPIGGAGRNAMLLIPLPESNFHPDSYD